MQFNYISFLNLNSFIGINITIDGYSKAYIHDITGCRNNAVIHLPTLGIQNGAQFYLQVVGTVTNNTIVKFGSNWIYTANATGGSIGSAFTVNTNYALTYYATAGNPWGTNYPSYTMNIYPANAIPLNNFIHCYILLTNMTYSCVGICEMPHGMINGQQIVFKDYTLGLNVTQLKLQRIDSSTVDKTISVTLNTAGLVKRYVYNSLYNDLISI